MKYLRAFVFIVSLLFLYGRSEICLAAQLGEVTSIKKLPHGVILTGKMTDGARAEISITFYSDSIVRIRLGSERVLEKESLLLEAVHPVEIPFKLEESAAMITIESDGIRIEMQKNPARIAFSSLDGEVLLAENNDKDMELLDGKVAAYFKLNSDDHFFGFGEKYGELDKAGTTVVCYNKDAGDSYGDDTYINIPFYMNPKGYGVFFHTTWRTVYNLGNLSSDWFSMRADGGDLDYFFIYGPQLKKVLAGYTYLTGRSAMPPKWSLGLWHGTYTGGHKGKAGFGQEEFLEIATKFRKLEIPCDVLRIDSNWDDLLGSDYIWHKSYPQPVAMIDEIKAMGFKMSLHDRPIPYGILRKYPLRMGWLAPPQLEYLDFSIPAARVWWWSRHEVLIDMGVDAFKPDIGEEIPVDAKFANGMTGAEMHNLYAKLYVQTHFEGLKKYTGKRAVVFARSGYVGSQRYPLIWGGDQHYSRWDCLPTLIRAGQSAGMSGYPLWSQDIGGIGSQKGVIPPADLYVRWAQFGFFNGVPQTFGRPWREPWKYDKEVYDGIDVNKIFKEYAELRYQMFPYIYSLVWEAHQTGMPLMRSMVLEFQNDAQAWSHDLQYMFGPNLLVAPIYDESGERKVYLPEGVWIDYWTDEKVEGPQNISVKPALERLPLFVRGGAIIPMGPAMLFTGEKPLEPIAFHFYPAEKSEFTYYYDDGESYDYEKGHFSVTQIRCEENDKTTQITFAKPEGQFENVETKTVLLQVHNSKPVTIHLNKNKMKKLQNETALQTSNQGWIYNAEKNLTTVKVPYEMVKRGRKVTLEK